MSRIAFLIVILVSVLSLSVIAGTAYADASAGAPGKDASVGYFNKMLTVMESPRCMNCHPRGNQPLQGADNHPHIMNVQRGADDHGAVGMKCATCHGNENNPNSGVPGAPNWGLAPISMGWVGLNHHELCLAIKD